MEQIINITSKHLSSLDQICHVFGRGKKTVRGWYDNDAPIAFDGQRYFAEYNALQAWLVMESREKTKLSRKS